MLDVLAMEVLYPLFFVFPGAPGLRPVGHAVRDAAPDRCRDLHQKLTLKFQILKFTLLPNLGRAEHRRHYSFAIFMDGGQANARTRCTSSLKLSGEGRV